MQKVYFVMFVHCLNMMIELDGLQVVHFREVICVGLS